MKVKIINDPARCGTSIIVYKESGGKTYALKGQDLEFVECKPGEMYPVAFMVNDRDEDVLYSLSQALSDFGFKPNVEKQYIESTRATEKHLEDMRTIAMHILKIQNFRNTKTW